MTAPIWAPVYDKTIGTLDGTVTLTKAAPLPRWGRELQRALMLVVVIVTADTLKAGILEMALSVSSGLSSQSILSWQHSGPAEVR